MSTFLQTLKLASLFLPDWLIAIILVVLAVVVLLIVLSIIGKILNAIPFI